MSIHIDANPGDIARTVLLPGDPLRAKFIAENMLEDAVCYNEVRGMYGFTGLYKGKRVSVQGTGMGIPSISIYVNELITVYETSTLIRIGTCGSNQPDIKVRDIILAMSASTDSSFNKIKFGGLDFAATASFKLLKKAFDTASQNGIDVKVGSVLTGDSFYSDMEPARKEIWMRYGILASEMEAAALYTLAARFKVEALTILTVSDSRFTKEKAPAEDREKSYTQMIELALDISE